MCVLRCKRSPLTPENSFLFLPFSALICGFRLSPPFFFCRFLLLSICRFISHGPSLPPPFLFLSFLEPLREAEWRPITSQLNGAMTLSDPRLIAEAAEYSTFFTSSTSATTRMCIHVHQECTALQKYCKK